MTIDQDRNFLLAGVGGVLVLSSVIAGGIHLGLRHRHSSTVANLTARIKAWWVMAALLTAAFLAGNNFVILLFALVSFASLREFMTVARPRRADRVAMLTAFFFVLPVQFYLVSRGSYALFLIFVPLCAFLALPILAVLRSDSTHFLARVAVIQWGLMISVYCVSYIPALLTLTLPGTDGSAAVVAGQGQRAEGPLLAVFLLIISQASDVMQYVFGKLFGRHKISPVISPAKTIEGFAGGLACAAILGALLSRITPFGPWQAAAMALVIALTGFLGGLVMSAIKRDRGIKDWGNLIAGHGGMLDRVDSVSFAAPLFFHLARYCLNQ
ncbi:MAG TPA: phosphatidate cytidylyltransferase [Candidatus Angelobacter sp.]